MATKPIYEFYAELQDYEPKMWRRFQVLNDMTMARLAYTLMTIFEMKASHQYRFEVNEYKNYKNGLKVTGIKGNEYDEMVKKCQPIAQYGSLVEKGTPIQEGYKELEDAKEARMRRILQYENDEADFYYGDSWHIKIKLEKKFQSDYVKKADLPRVIEVEGYGIIEDCGGPEGLEKIRETFKKREGKEYEEYRKKIGIGELDLDKLDIWDLNFRLKEVPTIFKKLYEENIQPTEQEIKLLERKYEKVKPKDISINIEEYKLNVRSACIIQHNNKILLHRNLNSNHYALLGGRVQIGEDSEKTIKREVKEELGKEIEITGYIGMIENFFRIEELKCHEYMFVYKAEFKEEEDKKIEENMENLEGKEHLKYEWIELDKMEEIPIKPKVMKEILREGKYPVHRIFVDNKGEK